MLSVIAGWDITGWAVAVTATITAVGLIWTKVLRPVRNWWLSFKAWMERIETATAWTEQQMKPNGGGSLVDKVDMLLRHDAERDVQGMRYPRSRKPPAPDPEPWEMP